MIGATPREAPLTLRVYAVADIHGRPERFDLIRAKAVETAADLIVMAGDISGFLFHHRIPDQLSTMPVPVFYIRGNSDRKRTAGRLKHIPGITHLHLKQVPFRGWRFAGISGTCLIPFDSRLSFREGRLAELYNGDWLVGASVLVAHPPPRGSLDRVMGRFHAGSKALRAMTLKYQPSVLICGHIHEDAGAAVLGKTLVVNCSMAGTGAGVLVDCRAGSPPRATIL